MTVAEARALTVGSLFSGIGGIDLGLERAGMRVIWQAEIEPYCARVLAKHWPTVPNLGDVNTIEWSEVERPDLICGGFPCQPVSVAGRRLAQDDERWLWPAFVAAVRTLRPRFVFVENVPGLLTAGFGDVVADLAELGYDVDWECLPAAAVGAPHLRFRLFVVAHANGQHATEEPVAIAGSGSAPLADGDGPHGFMAHPEGIAIRAGLCASEPAEQWRGRSGDSGGAVAVAHTQGIGRRPFGADDAREAWSDHIARHAGQLPGAEPWPTEPDVGRVADGVPSRVDRLRALGNAVVPPLAEWVGRRIMEVA